MQRDSSPRGRPLQLVDTPGEAACYLQDQETLFLPLRGRSEEISLVGPPEEVFGRAEVKCRLLSVRPTDFLGNACLHCARPTSELRDFMICVRASQVVAAFHESCFKRWFVLQDKASFGTYRFGLLASNRLLVGDGLTKISLLGGTEPLEEVPITPVQPIEYTELADPGLEAEAAFVRKQGENSPGSVADEADGSGTPNDSNILFCPHCDHPNRVPFLETEGAHHCGRCQGRFGVKIVAL